MWEHMKAHPITCWNGKVVAIKLVAVLRLVLQEIEDFEVRICKNENHTGEDVI